LISIGSIHGKYIWNDFFLTGKKPGMRRIIDVTLLDPEIIFQRIICALAFSKKWRKKPCCLAFKELDESLF
jgi:predicted ATP-grasp superfamily ATP-dependent carboligase